MTSKPSLTADFSGPSRDATPGASESVVVLSVSPTALPSNPALLPSGLVTLASDGTPPTARNLATPEPAQLASESGPSVAMQLPAVEPALDMLPAVGPALMPRCDTLDVAAPDSGSHRKMAFKPVCTVSPDGAQAASPAAGVADAAAASPAAVARPTGATPRWPFSSLAWAQWFAFGIRAAGYGAVVVAVAAATMVVMFRFVDPPGSMLMATKRLSGATLQQDWVPLERIAISLRRAVVTSEDAKFCRHYGFDLGEIRAAMRAGDGFGRGASTITQQVAKNMFLWPGKSYVRKALEVPITLAIEAVWPKRRILEVYLNIAEWGPDVFGAEAGAQYYFNKPASALTEREASLMAVSLPNPIARDASDPDPKLARRAATLQSRMRVAGISHCVLGPVRKN